MTAPLRLQPVPPKPHEAATLDADRERRSRPGIVLWDEIGRTRSDGGSVMLEIGARVALGDAFSGVYGTVIGRARDWPMRYDLRLDDGRVLRDVTAPRLVTLREPAS